MTTAVADRSHRQAVAELERGLGPFGDPGWREDLALLGGTVRFAAMTMGRDAEVLVALAARVPRSPGDERGGTPWTSFVREVALVRKTSDQAAAAEVAFAHALLRRHPRTLELLSSGAVPAWRARVLVEECAGHIDAVAAAAEDTLADRLADLPPSRIRQQITLLALRLDTQAQARQEAEATVERTASRSTLPHAQAEVVLTGPAVQVQRWWDVLTDQARALKAAGDPRSLGQLRFDLAMQTDPRGLTGLDPLATAVTGLADGTATAATGAAAGAGEGLRLGLGTPLTGDGRCTRPVQATITVPAQTALGLADEPGWLDGYGWISAPLSRRLLTVAELRKACLSPTTGQLIDLADQIQRPPPDPRSLRQAIRRMVLQPHELRPVVTDPHTGHDPSPRLSAFITARDRYCDGPTGTQVPARRTQQDHEQPWPAGPTAAWNLVSRAARTHQLKHSGWHPARDALGTTWTSPAGQSARTPHHHHPPPALDGRPLTDPDALADADLTITRGRIRPWADQPDPPPGPARPPAAPASEPAQNRQPTGATRHGWPDDPQF